MRLGIIGKDKPERVFLAVHNAESSAAFTQGQPVCFVMNGTNDGNDVVLANTGTAVKATTLFAGVVVDSSGIANGAYGVAQVFGFCQKAVLVQRTRAASTDSWSTVQTINSGMALNIDTVNNGFVSSIAGAATQFLGFAIIGASQASIAGSASSTSNSSTAQTTLIPIFLRAM